MRSVLGLTLLLVGGVVLLLGAGVAGWITAEDRGEARRDARRQHEAAERELRALAHDLVADAEAVSRELVRGADRRLRLWIAEEPLDLYRDPVPPNPLDNEALRRGLSAGVRARSLAESEHVGIVTGVMEERAGRRIERAAEDLRHVAAAQAVAATEQRGERLVLRLGLLLLGMALLLAGTLYTLVVAPVQRLRGAVNRIAEGDLATPVVAWGWPTREMAALAGDVERMRHQIRAATVHLEDEVAKKTRSLAETLALRTKALDELRATQDRLVQAEKMAGLGTLAGGVAHEFNNLLGGVLACLESARAGTTDAAVLEDLDMARRTAGRATQLIEALLGVTRPGERTFRPVPLAAVVEDVVRAAGPEARKRRVRIERLESASPVVEGDEGQLHQVVLNLVANALRAVDDGERIVVALGAEDRFAVLEVRDQGPGIPPEDRRRVFEPFFTGRAGGTGLGLFVSYGIVERHGGRIEVGEAPEGGARFTVRLPLAG
jgi:signal transduction histidine kinase